MAAGDGRLTAAELDERLEAALTAVTYRELAVLTADLPAAGSLGPNLATAKPKDVMRITHRGGNAHQVGRWVVPKRMEIRVTGGNVRLDFTQAVITEPTLHIDAHIRGGNLTIITRPGVVVDASEVSMIGGNLAIKPASEPEPPVILTVEMSGEIRGGNIRARRPRRTFLQWLLRRPRQLP